LIEPFYYRIRNFQKNLNFIIETNGYPPQFIFGTISRRLKILFNKRIKKQNIDNLNDEGRKGWFLILFIPNMTEKFKNIANILKIKLTFFSLHKLNRIIGAQKILYR